VYTLSGWAEDSIAECEDFFNQRVFLTTGHREKTQRGGWVCILIETGH